MCAADWREFHPGRMPKPAGSRVAVVFRCARSAMKILFVHAHFDDYEFTAAGTFEMWRRKLGDQLRARVVVCTDGKAGHHARTREETGRLRLQEQLASAKIGGYEFATLRYPDGRIPREACLHPDTGLLAALWQAIREFEPDYLFCPPLPVEPSAGIHIDHVAVAEAIRKVAYMINVPHAFTPEFPADETKSETCKVPVILNVYDGYMSGANSCDLVVDVDEAFPDICRMSWCHQSQIAEWLPWVGRHNMEPPRSPEDWSKMLRHRFERRACDLGIRSKRVIEVFTVTAWGEVPAFKQLITDLPNVLSNKSNLARLKKRLARWRDC